MSVYSLKDSAVTWVTDFSGPSVVRTGVQKRERRSCATLHFRQAAPN